MMEVSFVTRPTRVAGTSVATCSYPESELSYFKGVLQRGRSLPHYDGRLVAELSRFIKPGKVKIFRQVMYDFQHNMTCLSDPTIPIAGRGVLIPQQVVDNLNDFLKPNCRSFRWNENYQWALEQVRSELGKANLQALTIDESAEAHSIQKNLEKNAGYIGYLLGKRSKGEVLAEAVEVAKCEEDAALRRRNFDRPFVVAVRPQGSLSEYDPSDTRSPKTWKVKDRVIQMTSLDHLLQENRFGEPASSWINENVEWAEGGMSTSDLCREISVKKCKYQRWASLDYHHYDSSESDWLIEDAFKCIREMFVESSYYDALLDTICQSFIHRRVDWNGNSWFMNKGVPSGSRFTYLVNTIVNRIMNLTAMKALGVGRYDMYFCGDDALLFYDDMDLKVYTKYISNNFGIKLSDSKCTQGLRSEAPKFLSRRWFFDGAERDFCEVLFNLQSPERYRNYIRIQQETGVEPVKVMRLMIVASYYDQSRTVREWLDVDRLFEEADANSEYLVYKRMASLGLEGAGFWFDQMKIKKKLS